MIARETAITEHAPPLGRLRLCAAVSPRRGARPFAGEAQMGKRVQIGDHFGRLEVIGEAERYHAPCGQVQRRVICNCQCGVTVTVRASSLRSGLTVSCGCRQREVASESGRNSATHGMDGTPTYKAWGSMKQRCLNPNHEFYRHYGGRGITICERWLSSFENFLADMGVRPDGLTLDRIDNNGNYEPGNCQWATRHQQNSNRRSSRIN